MRTSFAILFLTVLCAGTALAGVTVTLPSNGASVGSPVHFVASASSTYPISAMWIYVNSTVVYKTSGGLIDAYVSLSTGSKTVNIKAWNTQGTLLQASLSINVGTSSSDTSSTTVTTGTSIYDIDQKSGWQVCSSCAGVNGVQDASSSFSQYQASPSMDGKSMKFWIGGTTPYRNALWHVGLGATSAQHFIYDVYFYITNPSASMALEWDLNQYINGKAYIFGVQCNVKSSHTWDVWDPYNKHWNSTGISCPQFPGYTWNHLVEEFERTADGHLHFVAITYNGTKHYVNKYFWPSSTSWYGMGIDYQMDGDAYMTDYSTWLDKLKVTKW